MKEQLLQFILDNVTDTMKLNTTEHLEDGRHGTKLWMASKEKTYTVIRDNFNDTLLGYMPGDQEHIIQIDSWELTVI